MEQKHMLMSALSVGIGVGVGIGLASGQTVSRWTGGNSSENTITLQIMEQEVLNLIVEGKDSKVTFDEFPYYLRSVGYFPSLSVHISLLLLLFRMTLLYIKSQCTMISRIVLYNLHTRNIFLQ